MTDVDDEEWPSRQRFIDQKSEVSSKISETCRFIGFGLVAFYYAIQATDSEFTEALRASNGVDLTMLGLMGVLTLVFDYFQYLFGYWSTEDALERMPAAYDTDSFFYHGRHFAFWAKQVSALLGAGTLTWAIYWAGSSV